MRLRAVVLLAFAALFSDATRARLAADPPPSTGETGVLFTIVPEDTRCPAATHVMKYCENSPGTFVVFVNPNKRHNNLPIGGYCTVRGDEDLRACPPYRLIHVRRIEKLAAPPLPCEPPTYP